MDETSIKDKTNIEKLNTWVQAGVDDGTINELLRKKYLGADTSLFVFQTAGFVTSIVAVFIAWIRYADILLSMLAAVFAMVFLYCILENYKDRKIRKTNIEKRLYEVCDVEAFDLTNNAGRKYCYVKDKEGTVFMKQEQKDKWVPKKVMYYAYFSGKDYSARLLRMRYSRNSVLYIVFPVAYLKGMLK